MSLRIWLPLNGSLKQQGCSNVTATNNGATVNSAGKIGSCYSFDGSDDYISLSGTDLYNIFTGGSQQFSICFWVYHADSTRAIIFGDYGLSGTMSFNIELSTSHQVRFYWAASPDKTFNAATNVAAAEWSHVVITYNGTVVEIYKDGIKSTDKYSGTLATKNKTSGVFYLGRDSRTGTTVLNGRLNDFRIYDHCLSAAEVHEISQGLVLHYKLDRFQGGYGNPNLYTGSKDFSGSWVNGSNWTTATEVYQGFTVKQRSATWGGLCQNVTCTQNDIFTVSFYAKVDSGGQIMSIHRSSLGNVTTGLSILGGNFSSGTNWIITSQDGTQWKRYWATVQITSADITYLQWRIENNQSGKNLYVCGMKLEKGSSHTDWSPAASENSFNIIQDSSGYGHNGSCVNTTIVASEARYSNCISCLGTTVDSSSNTITGAQFFYCNMNMPATNNITVTWWGKNIAYGRGGIFETSASVQTDTSKGTDYNTTAIANWDSTFRVYNGSSAVNIFSNFNKDGNWHHHAIIYDGANVKYYCDGILKQTSALTGNLPAWKSFCMGLGKAGGVWRQIKQYVSDLRIYCTALSADDILSLYHTSAKIDKGNNIHTFEFIENQSKISITKHGQTKCDEFEETTNTKFRKDKIIETAELIEF